MTPRRGRPLLSHHQATLDKAVAELRADPCVEAAIVGGSIAKGLETPASDVDLIVVLDADGYARRRDARRVSEVVPGLADYDGGYVDLKYVDRAYLSDAAERGSEPTRDSFVGAFVAWTRVEELEGLLAAIPAYPEALREEKIRRFYSQALIQRFFLKEALKRSDPFLTGHAKSQMILFAGRTLLAHDRILFPSAKRLLERVETAPSRPAEFGRRVADLLADPSGLAAGEALMTCLDSVYAWGIDWGTALGLYMEDSEVNWRDGRPPLSDW